MLFTEINAAAVATLYFAFYCITSTTTQLLFHCKSGCVSVGPLPGVLRMQFTATVYTVGG